jgi:hypothetical protein
VPAILDEIVRRLPQATGSFLLGPFALLVTGVEREQLAPAAGRFRRLLHLALADYLDALSVELRGEVQAGAETLADDVLAMSSPRLHLYSVRLMFAAGGEARGKRLLDYLFEQRSLLEPEEWPPSVSL